MSTQPDDEVVLRALERIDRRRQQRIDLEWKLSLSLWATLAVTANTLADLEGASPGPAMAAVVTAIAAGLVVTVLHGAYLFRFVRPENESDLNAALACERDSTLAASPEENEATESGQSRVPALFQLGVTTALTTSAIGTLALAVY